MAEQCHGLLPVIRADTAVIGAVPYISEGFKPFIRFHRNMIRFSCNYVLAEIRMFPPFRVRQIPAFHRQHICQVPGMTVCRDRRSVNTAPVQLPHEFQRFDRQPQRFGSCRGSLCRSAKRGSIDFLNVLVFQALRGGQRLNPAPFRQAVMSIIRLSVTNKYNPHAC